jgi:hypothetical protein
MPAGYAPRRRVSRWRSVIFSLAALAFVGGGGILSLWAAGVPLPFLSGEKPYDPYLIRVPINARPIAAYSQVERADLLDPRTGSLIYQELPPQWGVGMAISGVDLEGQNMVGKVVEVRQAEGQLRFVLQDGAEVPHNQVYELGGALLSPNAIIGRVVKKDKTPGLGFREDNFFPKGTPAGIAGATPPGLRSVTLDASHLTGVHALNAGDHIDLLANVPVDKVGVFQTRYSHLPVVTSKQNAPVSDSATQTMMLAQNAIVLKPVYVRSEAMTSSSLTQGQRVQSVPKYEVALAVQPEDVIPLQNALNQELKITCIAHSMRPDDEPVADPREPPSLFAPVTVRPILAYEVVTREAFVDPATRQLRMQPVSQEQVDQLGIVTSLNAAIGAVARHDIPAGNFLTKRDLLSGAVQSDKVPGPVDNRSVQQSNIEREATLAGSSQPVQFHGAIHRRSQRATLAAVQQPAAEPAPAPGVVGDRPAVARFIPAGYTAFAIPWNRLYGAEYLQIEDRIDLLCSYSLERQGDEEETETRPDGTTIVRKRTDLDTRRTLRTWEESLGFRGEPWFVATGAIVVGPVGFPPPAPAQRALGEELNRAAPNRDAKTLTGPPVIIAVDVRDVEAVAAALATKDALFTPALHAGEESVIDGGLRRVAVAAQDLPAYELLTETVWQGNRRQPASRLVQRDDPRFVAALDIEQIAGFYGRVLKRFVRKGDFFAADDFLPSGMGPGVAAGVGPGSTVFAASDLEIEGLDRFVTEDRVAILVRGVVKRPEGVIAHGFDWERPVARVVVNEARILRASQGGQTVLEVANEDLSRLQAAWAASFSEREDQESVGRRSHLLAVGLPRSKEEVADDPQVAQVSLHRQPGGPSASSIPDFDPLSSVRVIEAMVGSRRQWHAFAGEGQAAMQESSSFNFQGR